MRKYSTSKNLCAGVDGYFAFNVDFVVCNDVTTAIDLVHVENGLVKAAATEEQRAKVFLRKESGRKKDF